MQAITRAKIENPRETDILALKYYPSLFFEALGFDPDPWQERVLDSESNRILLNCCRQSGKSSISAALAIQHALWTPKAMIIVISHVLEQAKETFRKIVEFYKQVGRPVLSVSETVQRMELANKSRIVTLTGEAPDSVRGYSSVSLLLIDEAAMVREETYTNARPMLAVSNGRIILLSTPHGRRGFFWRAFDEESNWHKETITAAQCPRLTPEFLKEEKLRMPGWMFEQEFNCQFAELQDSIFKPEDIAAAFNHPELGGGRHDIDLSMEDI